jgi:cation transport ATPase
MDDPYSPRPIARWFSIAAAASLLFMALGCVSYLMHVFANPATMPLDQRAAYAAEPAWVTGAYAIAVWIGLIGGLFLVLRRRSAEWALLISLIAVIAWLAGLFLVRPLRESLSTNDYAVAVVVTVLTWTIYWFARHSRQRGWLR